MDTFTPRLPTSPRHKFTKDPCVCISCTHKRQFMFVHPASASTNTFYRVAGSNAAPNPACGPPAFADETGLGEVSLMTYAPKLGDSSNCIVLYDRTVNTVRSFCPSGEPHRLNVRPPETANKRITVLYTSGHSSNLTLNQLR